MFKLMKMAKTVTGVGDDNGIEQMFKLAAFAVLTIFLGGLLSEFTGILVAPSLIIGALIATPLVLLLWWAAKSARL